MTSVARRVIRPETAERSQLYGAAAMCTTVRYFRLARSECYCLSRDELPAACVIQCSIPARNDAGATFRILTSPGCIYPPIFCYALTRTSGAVISVQRAPPGEQIGADAARKKTENRPKMAKAGTFECAVAHGCM